MKTIPNKPGVYNLDGISVVVTTEAIVIDAPNQQIETTDRRRLEAPKKKDFWDNADSAVRGINLVLTGRRD